ncbi:MAG: hypothetical protein AAFX92_03825 [Pseudomonadota bacterium]
MGNLGRGFAWAWHVVRCRRLGVPADKGRFFAALHRWLAEREQGQWQAVAIGHYQTWERARDMADAAAMAPIHWQARHDVDGVPALGPVDHQINDASGGVGAPLGRRRSPLDAMLARQTITAAEYAAGRQFESLFARARFEALQACDLLRPTGGRWQEASGAVQDARDQVSLIVGLFDGCDPIQLEAVWQVIGQGRTVKEFCALWGLGSRAAPNRQFVAGLLKGALSVLSRHFGIVRPRPRARVERGETHWRVPADAESS